MTAHLARGNAGTRHGAVVGGGSTRDVPCHGVGGVERILACTQHDLRQVGDANVDLSAELELDGRETARQEGRQPESPR